MNDAVKWEKYDSLTLLARYMLPGMSFPPNQVTPITRWASFSHSSGWLTVSPQRADYSIESSGTEHTPALLQSVIHQGTLSTFNILRHAAQDQDESRHRILWIHSSRSLKQVSYWNLKHNWAEQFKSQSSLTFWCITISRRCL